MKDLSPYYNNFIWEAENFFVKKFITNSLVEKELSFCLDLMLNIANNPETDYNKGLIAFNPRYGQTKTFFFEVVGHRYRRLTKQNLFKKTSAKELVSLFKEYGEAALLNYISVRNLFIDDIGDEGEEKTVSHYSNKLNVLRFVLLKRYEMWEKTKGDWRTFGTTNLTIEEIAAVYDGRVSDRLLQMTYIRHFNFLSKGSFRQIKECRKLTPAEVRANFEKIRPPEAPKEEIDVIKYLNELLEETPDYLNNMGAFNWSFVKNAMIEIGQLSEDDFKDIPENILTMAEIRETEEAREWVRKETRHTTADVKTRRMAEAINKITTQSIESQAQAIITRDFFFKLRDDKNFKFMAKYGVI